jgi:PAS domain S-box-containing protein
VSGRDLGVVAKTDLSALHGPFLASATLLSGIVLLLMASATWLFFLVGNPIVRRIREGDHKFRELFENMRSGAAVLRPTEGAEEFIVTDLNRGAERIDCVSRQEELGRPFAEVCPAMRSDRLGDALRRVRRTGRPEHVSTSFGDGEQVEAWRENDVYKLPSGELVVLYDDVTDRKRAEEALRESEGRWRSIIEANVQAIIIVDQKHGIRFVNNAAERLFGKTAQELIGAPFGFPFAHGEVAEIEIVRPNRSVAFGEMRAMPMRWSGRDNFLLFIQDVSAHKRAEGDLRKLFQAIEQSPASVMITDIDGRIEYVNPKFIETTGYTYAEVVGKSPAFLRSGYTSPVEYQELWRTISAGHVWRGEFQNRRKNGELFWELASIAPVRDVRGQVTHYVAVKEDISERKATEERLRHAQRMEMIGQLTGGIAHDFNNLLAIILGNLQLLEEKPVLDAESRGLIVDAMWSAERGAQLTHRLLAFARRQRLHPKIAHVNQIVGEMTGLLRRTLGERIEIREQLAPEVCEIMIDRGQLENALLNLVVNARDAMQAGGVLTIATGKALLPRDAEGLREDVMPGEYAVLSVADTGTGMPANVLERIFEPFFTTKKFGEGSGLGLSMVYGFVRQSGGHISVESTVGRGSSVMLYLPRASTLAELAQADGKQEVKSSDSKVILVVEDDSRIRKATTKILSQQGYEVVEANNAVEALAVVDRLPRLDLLLTDIVLPTGMNGSELAQQVLRRRPKTRILLTSDYAQQQSSVHQLVKGGTDLLPKPYHRSELTTRIRELLDRPAN